MTACKNPDEVYRLDSLHFGVRQQEYSGGGDLPLFFILGKSEGKRMPRGVERRFAQDNIFHRFV